MRSRLKFGLLIGVFVVCASALVLANERYSAPRSLLAYSAHDTRHVVLELANAPVPGMQLKTPSQAPEAFGAFLDAHEQRIPKPLLFLNALSNAGNPESFLISVEVERQDTEHFWLSGTRWEKQFLFSRPKRGEMGISIGFPKGSAVKIYSGKPDPKDPSRFTFDCDIDGKTVTVEAILKERYISYVESTGILTIPKVK